MDQQNTPEVQEKKESFFRRLHITDSVLYTLIISFVLMFLGDILLEIVLLICNFQTTNDAIYTIYLYASFISSWIIFLAAMILIKRNRFLLQTLGHKRAGNNLKMLGVGLLIGFAMNMICILAALLHGDIHIYYEGMNPLLFVAIFLSVFIQSSAEELICRCYAFEKIRRRHRPITAILSTSVFFAALHLPNPGMSVLPFIDILVTGILFAVMVYYMDSLWCAFAVHTAWNFTQNILMGLPNSGMVASCSVFHLDAASACNSFAYNVDFGVEGTIVAILVNGLAAVLIVLIYRKRKPSVFQKPNTEGL